MKKTIALLLSALLLSAPALAQTSDQMPEKQGEWQQLPDTSLSVENKEIPAWLQYRSPYSAKSADLTVSHLSAPEISAWTQEAVSDVLSFSPANYTDRLTGFKKYFVVSGWKAYAEYLSKNGLPDLVKGQQYTLNAIVNRPPHVLKEGAINGVYRWLVETPVTLSLSRANGSGQSQTVPSTARNLNVLTQIVRIGDNGGPAGLAIENWTAQDVPVTAPQRPQHAPLPLSLPGR